MYCTPETLSKHRALAEVLSNSITHKTVKWTVKVLKVRMLKGVCTGLPHLNKSNRDCHRRVHYGHSRLAAISLHWATGMASVY